MSAPRNLLVAGEKTDNGSESIMEAGRDRSGLDFVTSKCGESKRVRALKAPQIRMNLQSSPWADGFRLIRRKATGKVSADARMSSAAKSGRCI